MPKKSQKQQPFALVVEKKTYPECSLTDNGAIEADSVCLVDPTEVMTVDATSDVSATLTLFRKADKKPFARKETVATLTFADAAAKDSVLARLTKAAHAGRTLPSTGTVYIVINPNSGTGGARARWEQAKPLLEFFGIAHKVTETTGPRHAVSIAEELCAEVGDHDVVCSVGGDGVLHELVNGFGAKRKRVTISMIPTGTGNGMASTLGIRSFEDAVWNLVRGSLAPLDTFKYTQKDSVHRVSGEASHVDEPKERFAFLHMCYGIIADIDFESEWLRFLGAARFPITGVFKVLALPSYKAKIKMTLRPTDHAAETQKETWKPHHAREAAGKQAHTLPDAFEPVQEAHDAEVLEFEDDFVGVHMSNVAEISADMMTNPFAKIADGGIDVSLMRRSKTGRFQVLDFFNRVESDAMSTAPYAEHYKATSLTITPLAPTPYKGKLDLDGEWMPYGEVTLACCPSSLRILSSH